jgi:hypothetical protein
MTGYKKWQASLAATAIALTAVAVPTAALANAPNGNVQIAINPNGSHWSWCTVREADARCASGFTYIRMRGVQ